MLKIVRLAMYRSTPHIRPISSLSGFRYPSDHISLTFYAIYFYLVHFLNSQFTIRHFHCVSSSWYSVFPDKSTSFYYKHRVKCFLLLFNKKYFTEPIFVYSIYSFFCFIKYSKTVVFLYRILFHLL